MRYNEPVVILPQDEFDRMVNQIKRLENQLHELRLAYDKLKES